LQSAEKLAGYLARELSLDARQADRLRFGAETVFSTGGALIVESSEAGSSFRVILPLIQPEQAGSAVLS